MLPYELTYSEKPSSGSKNMKRLAVLVGKEKGEKIASGRGSGTSEQGYATRKVVATVVKTGDANQVVERMKKALGGEKAVVMISPVDDLVMI